MEEAANAVLAKAIDGHDGDLVEQKDTASNDQRNDNVVVATVASHSLTLQVLQIQSVDVKENGSGCKNGGSPACEHDILALTRVQRGSDCQQEASGQLKQRHFKEYNRIEVGV